MRPPYPAEIAPLLPQFLTWRRAKLDFVLRAAEELGLDRPAFIRGVSLHEVAPDGATLEELLFPYSVRRDALRAMLVAAAGAGLVEERDGLLRSTAKAREYARRHHAAARAHLATLAPLPRDELARLAGLLERAFQASAAAAPAVPHAHTPRALRYREGLASAEPMVSLDGAVYGLWMVRDDCHVAAWHGRGHRGPDLNALTRVWRGEATAAAGLAAALGYDGPGEVAASLAELRRKGLLAADEPLRLTDRGRAEREAIEAETDRLFFGPWPDDVGAEAPWIRDRLERVNVALAGSGTVG